MHLTFGSMIVCTCAMFVTTASGRDALPMEARSVHPPGEVAAAGSGGGCAGVPGAPFPFTATFEDFNVGQLEFQQGWQAGSFGANAIVVDNDTIAGSRSARHVADGGGINGSGLEMDSPDFCDFDDDGRDGYFGFLGNEFRLTDTGSLYQWITLDTNSGIFNTRINLERDGSIRVGQLRFGTDGSPMGFYFFDTGLTWTPGVTHSIDVDLRPDGTMIVYIDEAVGLIGTSAAFALDSADYGGHGRYLTFAANESTGDNNEPGSPTGTTYTIDNFTASCPGCSVPAPPPCALADLAAPYGVIDSDDVLAVINNWGPCPPFFEGGCPGDNAPPFAIVDSDDLLYAINSWGVCPFAGLNDDCDHATQVFFNGTTPFNTTQATQGAPTSGTCFDTVIDTGGDLWFRYEADCDGLLSFSAGADFNVILAVYEGADCGPIGAEVACDNDGDGDVIVILPNQVTSGEVFLVRILGTDAGFLGGNAGTGSLTVQLDCFPPGGPDLPNDDVEDAELIVFDKDGMFVDISQTNSATDDPTAYTCGTFNSIEAPGVWYTVIGTGNVIRVSLCGTEVLDPTFDTKLHVYCNDPDECVLGGQGCVGGDNDGCGADGVTPSEFQWCSEPGLPYLILVAGDNGSTGDFQITVTDDPDETGPCGTPTPCQFPNIDVNNSCFWALEITEGLRAYDNTCLYTTTGTATGCGQVHEDIWWYYLATDTGVLRVTTCEQIVGPGDEMPFADHDTRIAVYGGYADLGSVDCPNVAGQILGCNDDDPKQQCGLIGQSTVKVAVDAGLVYLIRLGNASPGDTGTGAVLVTLEPAKN